VIEKERVANHNLAFNILLLIEAEKELTWKEKEREKRRERKAAFVSLCLLSVSNIYFKYFFNIHVVKQKEIFLTAGWLMLSLSLSKSTLSLPRSGGVY
jgi:hypothetical protein